jgi:hypothetical protein
MTRPGPVHLALPLLAATALLCSCGGGSKGDPSTAPAIDTPAPTATGQQPVQTTPATPASATPTSALGLVVNGNGSDLSAPQSPTVRPSGGGACFGIGFDPGFSGDCQRLSSPLGTAVLDVETKGTEERTLLWTVAGGHSNLALRRVRTLPQPADSVDAQDGGSEATTAVTSDINNDGTPAFVVKTPAAAGAHPPLATLDIVQTSGLVGLHRVLHAGYAQKASGGGLETWTALGGDRFEHSVFQFQSGAWRVVQDGTVGRSQVPGDTGQF